PCKQIAAQMRRAILIRLRFCQQRPFRIGMLLPDDRERELTWISPAASLRLVRRRISVRNHFARRICHCARICADQRNDCGLERLARWWRRDGLRSRELGETGPVRVYHRDANAIPARGRERQLRTVRRPGWALEEGITKRASA